MVITQLNYCRYQGQIKNFNETYFVRLNEAPLMVKCDNPGMKCLWNTIFTPFVDELIESLNQEAVEW